MINFEEYPIEQELDELTLDYMFALAKSVDKGGGIRSKELFVTDLTSPCPRAVFFAKKYPFVYKFQDILPLVLGKLVHQIYLSERHEYPVLWEGISGRIDEIYKGMIIEKKTTSSIPPKIPPADYIRQVSYYSVMLKEQDGEDINKGAIIYIPLMPKATPVVRQFIIGDKEIIKKEMLDRKALLLEALAKDKAPARYISPHCRFCSFIKYCKEDDL